MAEDSEHGKSSFVFKDKRRFDSAGNVKEESAPAAPVSSGKTPEVETKIEKAPPVDSEPKFVRQDFTTAPVEEETSPTDINFSGFIMSLATQAMMQLGEMAPPPGMSIPEDMEGAKQTIDIITMLERKTKGNLSPNEAKLVEDILHNLRIAYVRSAKK